MRPGMLLMLQHPRRSQYAPIVLKTSKHLTTNNHGKTKIVYPFREPTSYSTIKFLMTQDFWLASVVSS